MKIHKPLSPLLLSIFFILISSNVYPCTTFVLRTDKGLVFGRNLDWITGTGLVLTNPRNLEKIALVDPSEKAIKWVSRFGSITFNQVGRELPYGGMNESGLIVEHMTLDETIYPSKDNRYAIGACQSGFNFSYVFPSSIRWIIPPSYGVLFSLIGLFFWWLAFKLPSILGQLFNRW